ncbi:MAG: DUF2199 domain-containing protein [Allomuricauda sp.]
MGDETIEDYTKIARVISLQEMIAHDKSILDVADLKPGFQAVRRKQNDKWIIRKIEYSDDEIAEMGYYCSECGLYHRDIPFAYGANEPVSYFNLADKSNSTLDKDLCIIDDKKYFIKGQIKIKVLDSENDFSWNVWVEIDKSDFDKEVEIWEEENRFLNEPYFGVLDTVLSCYPDTVGLKVSVQTQKKGTIPLITMEDSNHPLLLEQENAIDMNRVTYFAKKILYGHK